MFDDKMGELRFSAHPLIAKRRAVQTKTPRTKATVRQRNACARIQGRKGRNIGDWKEKKRERHTHHDIVSVVTHRGEDHLLSREDEDDPTAGETERGEGFGRRSRGEYWGGRLWERESQLRM
jgi:hypothetical protein